MFARTGTSRMLPGKMDQAIELYRSKFVPILKQQKGFKALYWLADSNRDKYTVLTLWETEADMLATETAGLLQQVLAEFANLVADETTIERYEVLLQV
jgi:heme-degrading monooxygenase HmoA